MVRLLRQCATLVALTGEAWVIREVFPLGSFVGNGVNFYTESGPVSALGWGVDGGLAVDAPTTNACCEAQFAPLGAEVGGWVLAAGFLGLGGGWVVGFC